jgi:hypothetical protein
VGGYIALRQQYILHLECANLTALDNFTSQTLIFSGKEISCYNFEGAGFEVGMILTITNTLRNDGIYLIESFGATSVYIYGMLNYESIAAVGVTAAGRGLVTYVYDLANNALMLFEGLVCENMLELSGGDRIENSNLLLDNDVIKIYPRVGVLSTGTRLFRVRTGRIYVGEERRNTLIRKIRIEGTGTITGNVICWSENYTNKMYRESFSLTDGFWKTLGKGVMAEWLEVEILGGDNISSIELLVAT